MKWAHLKMPGVCLLRLMPDGRRAKSFAVFYKANSIKAEDGKPKVPVVTLISTGRPKSVKSESERGTLCRLTASMNYLMHG